jgi:3',5'-cyclic AMP phosphodiesterase CpdA
MQGNGSSPVIEKLEVLFLHISDLHFRPDSNEPTARVAKLKEAVFAQFPFASHCFLVVSGDVANTGAPEEYSVAAVFFNDLRTALLLGGLQLVEIVSVPGNHDCNFRNQTDTRIFLLDDVRKYLQRPVDFSGSNFEAIIDIQADFFSFEADISKRALLPIDQRLYYQRTFSVGHLTIAFHCFNTAWLSRKDDVQAQLYIPETALKGTTRGNTDVSIAVFHHPYNWLNSENYRLLKTYVEREADFVMTGHEHIAGGSRSESLEGGQLLYLEAPVFQSGDSDSSGLNRSPLQNSEKSRRSFNLTLYAQ